MPRKRNDIGRAQGRLSIIGTGNAAKEEFKTTALYGSLEKLLGRLCIKLC